MTVRHLLADDDLTAEEQAEVLDLAAALKADRHAERPLAGPQAVAIIFDKPTLRTQLSFTTGVAELGGYPMVVDGNLAQIGTRESIADVARVVGRQVSAIVWRTHGQDRLQEMADHVDVPVVSLSRDALASIFLRKVTWWDNGVPMRPADLSYDSVTRKQFSDQIIGRSVRAVRSHWQQAIFSGQETPPPVLLYISTGRPVPVLSMVPL